MPKNLWTTEQIEVLHQMRAEGFTSVEIGQRLGRSAASVVKKASVLNISKMAADKPVQPAGGTAAVVQFENAALQAETEGLKRKLDDLRATTTRSAAGVENLAGDEDDYDAESEWKTTAEHNAKKIRHLAASNRFRIRLPAEPTVICFISDTHIAKGATDFNRMQEDAEIVRRYNWNAVLCGDMVDNGIRHRSMMINSKSNPTEEYQLFNYWLKMFGNDEAGVTNVLLMISGNHDAWTLQHGGVDMLKEIALQNRVAYHPAGARLDIGVGEQEYRIIARHQYRYHSHFNQLHAAKRLYDMGDDPNADIISIGHNHQCGLEQFWRHARMVWGCRPGSYQVSSEYSRQYGFPASVPTCPTFFLMPEEHRVIGFADIRDAVHCWTGMGETRALAAG